MFETEVGGFRFAGDAGGGAGGNQTSQGTGAATTPSSAPGVSAGQSQQTVGTGAGGVSSPPPTQTATAGAGSATPELPYIPVRDALQTFGWDARQYSDDNAALQALVQMARSGQESQQFAQVGRQVMPQLGAFQQWQQQQEEAKRQADASSQQKKWFDPPAWDPSWRTKILQDAQGNLVPAPGAPLDIVQRYQTARDHQAGFLEKFSMDPLGSIKPGLEPLIQEIAQKMIQDHLGKFQEQTFASQFLQQNSDWLYGKDQAGQPLRDPNTGKQALSPLGQRFQQYLGQAEQMGIRTEQERASYAKSMTERDYLMAQGGQQQQTQTAQQNGQQQKQNFLQQATNGAQHRPQAGAAVNGNGGVQNASLPLAQRMLASMQAGGVTDQQIRDSIRPVLQQ